jgi:hypothetical protein
LGTFLGLIILRSKIIFLEPKAKDQHYQNKY